MTLYVNDINTATATHTTTWNGTGPFQISDNQDQGSRTN